MTERLARAQLVKLEVDRLTDEARTAPPGRVIAIGQEVDVLYESLLEIRREQLREEVQRSRPTPRRSWWQRLTGRNELRNAE